jgi:hypothetical protein
VTPGPNTSCVRAQHPALVANHAQADGSPSEATLSGRMSSHTIEHLAPPHQSFTVSLTFSATPKPANSTSAKATDTTDSDALRPTRPTTTHVVPQSIPPPLGGSNSDVLNRIDNSLVQFIAGDSYMAKVSGSGMTNSKALAVLAGIERKLAGESMRPPNANRRYPGVRVRVQH